MKKRKKDITKELALFREWIEKYEYEIKEIFCGRLDFDIFRTFLMIVHNDDILDDFEVFEKHYTEFPIEIMLDEWEAYVHHKFPLVVACLDEKRDFIGVIGIDNPKSAVFTDEKYRYLQKEISLWIEKYKEDIQKLADKKMEALEFAGKLEYDIRNQLNYYQT